MGLRTADRTILGMMKLGPLERRGAWRFGTRTIADHVVDPLVDLGRAERVGDHAQLISCQRPEVERWSSFRAWRASADLQRNTIQRSPTSAISIFFAVA